MLLFLSLQRLAQSLDSFCCFWFCLHFIEFFHQLMNLHTEIFFEVILFSFQLIMFFSEVIVFLFKKIVTPLEDHVTVGNYVKPAIVSFLNSFKSPFERSL